MNFNGQVEYVNSYFGYPIYKTVHPKSPKYFVDGYAQEFDTFDLALEHAQFLMEKSLI